MKLTNINGFSSIDTYVKHRLSEYEKKEKNFETLFDEMFKESNNVMAEFSDGYRIKKVTYGEFKNNIIKKAPSLASQLSDVPEGSAVGLYMQNSMEWIEIFWSILICGYNCLIMNTRLPIDVLEKTLSDYSVKAVISDSEKFGVKTVLASELTPSDEPALDRKFGEEIVFMSSGTTENVKLCAYTGENFYYQIRDSVNIVKTCPDIKRHYEGELKQLILLPFCHVFGFIAVYLWFGFFARTFVFPKDLTPSTIQNTVKKHKVTHIFAVPMVWEAVYKAAISKIKAKSPRTYKKFRFFHAITSRTGGFGTFLAKRLFGELRSGLFGNSIQFIITGGSHVKPEVLKFFNGIGYHTANGYGMTEIGITSVEKSRRKKTLCSGTIGAPFGNTFYSLSDEGELLVTGKTRAAKITQNGVTAVTDYSEPFHTNDLAHTKRGRYFIDGRRDDLIISESGENLNPVIAERAVSVPGVDRVCIFADNNCSTVLLASIPGCFSEERLKEIYQDLKSAVTSARLSGEIKKIYLTHEELISGGEIKLNRRKIAKSFSEGKIRLIDPSRIKENVDEFLSELEGEVRICFAEILGKNAEDISVTDNFFTDLGGTSIDYFSLRETIKSRLGIDVITREGATLSTVKQICDYIKTL